MKEDGGIQGEVEHGDHSGTAQQNDRKALPSHHGKEIEAVSSEKHALSAIVCLPAIRT